MIDPGKTAAPHPEIVETGPAGSALLSSPADSRWRWVAAVVLLAGLAITVLLSRDQYLQTEEAAVREFDTICREIELKVEDRLAAHSQILRGGAAFFTDSDGVTREEWHEFTEQQKVSQKLPGIQGIGYTHLVPRGQLAEHTRKVRDEGFPDYRVWPEGDRDPYSSIIYLEPLSGRNLRAFGYDMLTEPVRRAALEQSRDSDESVLTGKVTLVQETNEDIQAGTLMYAPVYRVGVPHETVAERRAAIQGWVYSPYRMNDLMKGILGRRDLAGNKRIHLEIFDGETPSGESLLYDSQHGEKSPQARAARLTRRIVIDAEGRKWLLSFSQAGAADHSVAELVFCSGALLSLLLSGLVYSLFRTSSEARKLALLLTAQLSESEMRWRIAVEATGDGIFDWDVPSGTGFFSRRWKEMLGYSEDEIGDGIEEWESRIHPDDKEQTKVAAQALLDGKTPLYSHEHRMRCKGGGWKWILARGAVIRRDPDGKPLRVVGTHSDITEKRQTAEIKSRLISMASHEFRTPLATIRLAADILATCRGKMDEAGVQRSLQTILSTTDYMTGIVTDVLDLSSMNRDEPEDLSEILLGDFLRQIGGEFRGTTDTPATIAFEWDGTPVTCTGTPGLLKRAVNNLLDNAVKYSPPGTPVVLRLRQLGQEAVIEVEDQGIGIPEEEMAFLHDPFFRASNTAGIPGTGLGLTIVAEAMQRMGGKIDFSKRDGGGSIFTIRLPVAPAR